MRVTKEIAIALKEVGYDVPCNDYYMTNGEKGHGGYFNWNDGTRSSVICSAPTVYECIEWLDSKGVYVYVEPFDMGVPNLKWKYTIKTDKRVRIDSVEPFSTRLSAYTAGLPIAIDYIKNKKG
jgi:hypothetical protein